MEEWRNIQGYEGLYKVSRHGQIKNATTGRILSPFKIKGGYLMIGLNKNGVRKGFLIHRLVAIAFVPNPHNLPQVNHKDCNPVNNIWTNLEWCDAKYNSNYANRNKKLSTSLTNGNLSKQVEQYSKNGVLLKVFPSSHEASRQTGISRSHISACCLGKQTTCGGFVWKYKRDVV